MRPKGATTTLSATGAVKPKNPRDFCPLILSLKAAYKIIARRAIHHPLNLLNLLNPLNPGPGSGPFYTSQSSQIMVP